LSRVSFLFVACFACALVLSGCATSRSSSDKGPITDSASNGLKQSPAKANAPADAVHGKQIFAQNCASCHGVNAEGGAGPSLRGEKKRKDNQQTVAWIKDPLPPMPKLYPSALSASDVADVAAFVQTL
jgi:mono/diheme cytochrome c family protein